MLTRAISAPEHYGTPGILRYGADSLPSSHSSVKFAPLPQTETFGRRAKFSSRLGVQGRSGILSRQRQQHLDRINYDINTGIQEMSGTAAHNVATALSDGYRPIHDSTADQASGNANYQSPRLDSPLGLRRSASEDGTAPTSSLKRGGSLKFWKKQSKRPALPTIPSQEIVQDRDFSPPLTLAVREPAPHVASSGIPAAPHVEIATPQAPTEPNHELPIVHNEDADSSSANSDNTSNQSHPVLDHIRPFPPNSPVVANGSTDQINSATGAAEAPRGKTPEQIGEISMVCDAVDSTVVSQTVEAEVTFHTLNGKRTPPIVVPPFVPE